MNNSNTRGPWKVSYSVASGAITTYAINKGKVDHSEAKANVSLIEAAPDMFTALEKLMMQIQDQGLQDRFTLGLSHAETTLNKARGLK